MAISFIGSAENSAANGGDVTLTLPGGLQQNDLVIVAYAIGDNDNINENMAMVTAGYSELADLFADDTQDSNLGVFYKFMGATPDTTAQVDGLGGTDAAVAAVCMVFRGVDTTTPFDVTTTTATNINTMHPNPPSIDPVTANVWTVIAGASGHTLAGAGTYTFPSGYTTNAIDRGADDTSDVTVGMGYRSSPADPEDPGVMTHSGTDSASFSWCAATMALRPAPPENQTLSAGTPVVSFTAPAATRVATTTAAAGTPVVTFTAPAATLSQGSILSAGTPVVTFSAPTATRLAATVVPAGTPTVTVSAPTATRITGGVTLQAGTPTVTFTAPEASVYQPGSESSWWCALTGLSAISGGGRVEGEV